MINLEQLQNNSVLGSIVSNALVRVQRFGSDALIAPDKAVNGKVANEFLYRHDEPQPNSVEARRPWGFDNDGARFRLLAEAGSVRLAHLCDPVLSSHTSMVKSLPHRIGFPL
jgi:hypothetical protein